MKGIVIICCSMFLISVSVAGWGLIQQKKIIEEEVKQTELKRRLLEEEKRRVFYFQQANKKIDTLIYLRKNEH